MFGVLNINKPLGRTSRDVVNRVQRLVRPAKAGHAGTLDPLATGVLLVCVGPATRLVEYAQRLPKRYRATFRLGCRSASDDTELDVEAIDDAPQPTASEIEAALPQFVGQIKQRPPAYSAVKVAGRRSYDLARRGEAADLAARPVTIHALEVAGYDYPQLELDIDCGSGTYIRSLGRDLAASLGTAAVMWSLERTAIGEFTVAAACGLDELKPGSIQSQLHPPTTLVRELPSLVLGGEQVDDVLHGRPILRPETAGDGEFAALDENQQLVAILHGKPDGKLWPGRTFSL